LQRVVEVVDVDVGQDAGLDDGGQARAPVPDDMSGAVTEARRVRVAAEQEGEAGEVGAQLGEVVAVDADEAVQR
jgi:hypothetical protein